MLIYFYFHLHQYRRKILIVFMYNQNWQATNYQKDSLITNTKKYIKQKLDELQKELECPNEFIYDFIKDIQQDWDPDSFKLKAQKLQNK